ncbi:oligosaccharide flippase family protein [Wukongibacter sp. M2B1]|uniref:oligosaccharide flippase family protein n=1 Tax=Wukongibacter sp. M2B1 TaxID=3088895 RepID=UPI003D797A69
MDMEKKVDEKSFIKLGFIYSIGQVLMKAVYFILLPVYTRKLGTEAFGELALVNTLFSLISVFLVLGVCSGYVRFYREYDGDDRRVLRGTTLVFYLTMTCLDILFLLTVGKYVANLTSNLDNPFKIITLIVLRGLVNQYISLFICEYKLEYNAKKDVVLNLLRLVLNLCLIIFYVVLREQEIIGIYKGYLLGDVLILIYLIKDNYKKFELRFNLKMLREMLTFSGGLIPGCISDTVLNLSDRYFLTSYLSFSITGIYSIGYNFGRLIEPIFLTPFKNIFIPYKFQIWKDKEAEMKLNNMFGQYHIIGCFVMLGIAVYSKFVISIFTTPEYIDAYKIVPLVVFSYFLYGKTAFYCLGIQIRNKTYLSSIIMIIAGISNIILNMFLIPRYGMAGAAIATLLSYGIMNLIYLKVSVPLYHVKFRFSNMYRLYLVVLSLYSIYYIVSIRGYSLFIEFMVGLLVLTAYVSLLVVFKLVTINQLEELLKHIRNKLRKAEGERRSI